MHPDASGNCWSCGAALTAPHYAREVHCPGCAKATHVCRNCRFYTPGRHNDCAEPLAERVVEKDRSNFCDYFDPKAQSAQGTSGSQEDLRRAAEALFKI